LFSKELVEGAKIASAVTEESGSVLTYRGEFLFDDGRFALAQAFSSKVCANT
jgi:hypothetical protein